MPVPMIRRAGWARAGHAPPLHCFFLVLGRAQDLLLEGEDVVQDAPGAPSLQAMVGNQAGLAEQPAKPAPERTVDTCLARRQRFLEQEQAVVERLQPGPALVVHVPSTSTRPFSTLTLTAG